MTGLPIFYSQSTFTMRAFRQCIRHTATVNNLSTSAKYAGGFTGSVSVLYFPQLSPTMKTGKLLKWYASIGQQIKAYELICDVSTETLTQVQNSTAKKEDSYERNIMEIEVQEDVYIAYVFPLAMNNGAVLNIDEPIALLCEEEDDVKRVSDLLTTTTKTNSSNNVIKGLFPRALWQAYNKTRSESDCGGCS